MFLTEKPKRDIQPDPVWETRTIIPLRECVYGNEKFLFHGFFEEDVFETESFGVAASVTRNRRKIVAILEDMEGNLHRKESWQNIRFKSEVK